ncbi:MAG: S-layer family protein, partial [Calothrix sp. SM1_7_51]|nr:S-layer family protein [Calothrix sp. SM1_7_51]
TDVIAAFENSDISANSTDGRGGNININTQGLFGAQFRRQQTDQSDITATGKTSELQGNVQINKGIDTTRGLTQLPFILTESSNQITAACPALQDASFIVTGRGGLPENPKATRLGQVVLQDFRATANNSGTSKRENSELETSNRHLQNEQLPIVEAQSWVINKQGYVELVANIPHNSRSLWNDEIDCQGLRYRPQTTPDNLGG